MERVAHRAGRTYSPHRVIRLIERRTEHGQHSVSDELVECALELEDHPRHGGEEGVQRRRDLGRRHALGPRREPHQVGEQHRHLPLLGLEHRVGFALLLLHDAFGDRRRVVALEPLAAARLLQQAGGEAGLLDGDRGVVGDGGEQVQVGLGEALLFGRVHVQHAEDLVLRPERRAHEGPDPLPHQALGRVDAAILRHVGREHRGLVAHDGAQHRAADVHVPRAVAAAGARETGHQLARMLVDEQQEHALTRD